MAHEEEEDRGSAECCDTIKKMDKYLIPLPPSSSSSRNPIIPPRPHWKRILVELNGKLPPKYRHDLYPLLFQSYSQVGAFPHTYHLNGVPCPTHISWFANAGLVNQQNQTTRHGVTALEFDTKGVYLASVTKSGCLTVQDFDNLYSGQKEDEAKQLLHVSVSQQLDTVRWNLANQDEVACTSTKTSEVHIFDIGYISSEPVEVLRKKPTITVHGCTVPKGLSDVAFSSIDNSRLFASDMHGAINIWDRRISDLPCLELTTASSCALNSIKLHVDNQIIFGASKYGILYMWDLRGGRSSAAFQHNKEAFHSPVMSVKLAYQLEQIASLKAQSNIVPKEIHSIDFNPSCSSQLAFHQDDGWSGVLDIHTLQVTHIHCPPPPWLDGFNDLTDLSYSRKPSWLPMHSVYAIGSSSCNGLYLLDFYPDSSSPCHVDYDEGMQGICKVKSQLKQNRFISLSECVTACSAHPLNGVIVAGTKQSSLLLISQRYMSFQDSDECPRRQ